MKNIHDFPEGFDPSTYLELNPDVKMAGVDPILHYIKYGKNEGRLFKKSTEDAQLQRGLDEFLIKKPSNQNAFDIFNGLWTTQFSFTDAVTNGGFKGLQDERINWLLNNCDVEGKTVLELGPLEAAHTYMLEKHGAKILSIEANKGAFMRCLVVKNYFNLQAKFLLGDFEQFEFENLHYDLVLACGVLYHLKNPLHFLEKISASTRRIFIWTHYFEPDFTKWNPRLLSLLEGEQWDHKNPQFVEVNDHKITLIKQSYGKDFDSTGFCGGTDVYSNWIYKADIIWFIQQLGFNNIKISFDTPDHPNGPAFCLFAER